MSKHILLIEDNEDIRENTAEILQLANYKVTTAKNGKEGLEHLRDDDMPDLIICDIMMPVLDGYGVLHLLSKEEKTAAIPFIFLTAKAERSDLRKGMEMGADDYITKPFSDLELLKAIEKRLEKVEILRKEFPRNIDGLNEFMDQTQSLDPFIKLSENREILYIKKKDSIYSQDRAPKGIWFVQKGMVKTFRTNDDGKELITGLYKEGDFFGYLPLLEDEKYSDAAVALEDSEVCLIPKEDFHMLLLRNYEISLKFIRILSGSIREKEEQLIKLAYNSVRKRVADALLSLNQNYKTEDASKPSILIAREDLANLAGTSSETAIRTLSDFKSEGLIEIKNGAIHILFPERLSTLKN